jgi:hypothetical protein
MSTSNSRPFLVVAVGGLAVFALAAAWSPARTAPAPEGWKLPQKKLEELKKQLPKLLQDEALAGWLPGAEVRLVRQVGPEEAKVRVLVPHRDDKGRRHHVNEKYLIIHLRFHDGRWTTTKHEASRPGDATQGILLNLAAHRLMDLIDEATEK